MSTEPADEFERHAWRWGAQERMGQAARETGELLGADPDLALAVEKAVIAMERAFRGGDRDALWEAVADFLEAYGEAEGGE